MNTLLRKPQPSHRPTSAVLWALTLLCALAGCASPTSAPAPGSTWPGAPGRDASPGSSPSQPLPPLASPLVAEQRWLEEWFRGTPVLIVLTDINTLAVDVPLANSFDAGKSAPKPALLAVLDRVSTSLRRQSGLRVSIATPTDPAPANAALATARAQQVRDHLVSRGVPVTRMSGVGTARAGAAVQLRLLNTPQAIGRLDDASLPPPAAGLKPAPSLAPPAGVKR